MDLCFQIVNEDKKVLWEPSYKSQPCWAGMRRGCIGGDALKNGKYLWINYNGGDPELDSSAFVRTNEWYRKLVNRVVPEIPHHWDEHGDLFIEYKGISNWKLLNFATSFRIPFYRSSNVSNQEMVGAYDRLHELSKKYKLHILQTWVLADCMNTNVPYGKKTVSLSFIPNTDTHFNTLLANFDISWMKSDRPTIRKIHAGLKEFWDNDKETLESARGYKDRWSYTLEETCKKMFGSVKVRAAYDYKQVLDEEAFVEKYFVNN